MDDTVSPDLGQVLLDLFDHIFIINLPTRTDRKAEIAAQLARLNLTLDHPKVHLFAAIRPADKGEFETIGARGCFESHLGVLTEAIALGAETFLILEDDANFSDDFEARIAGLKRTSHQTPWDMWYGWNPLVAPGEAGDALAVIPSKTSFPCSHFIGMRRDVAVKALAYLQAIAARPYGHPDGGAMHVDGAYAWFRAAHPDIVTVFPVKPATYQRSSRTDIHDLKWFDRIGVLAPLMRTLRRLKSARR